MLGITPIPRITSLLQSEFFSHAPAEVRYTYNARGEVASIDLFLQGRSVMSFKREYYPTGGVFRVSGNTLDGDFSFTRSLNNNDQLTRIDYPNGYFSTYTLDRNSRVTSQTTTITPSLSHSLKYRYSANGNITLIQDEFNGLRKISRFKYDELNRLVEEDAISKRTYNLDLLGNNLSNGGQFNLLNQLLEDADYVYEYDLNGNRTKKTSKVNGEKFEYVFSPENKLTSVKIYKSGNILSKTISYAIDGMDRRISRSVQDHLNPSKSYVWKYVYEGQNVLAVLDGNNELIAGYIHGQGIDDPVLAITDVDSDGGMNVLSLIKDRQNSVRFVLNDNGTILQEAEYSAYGETKITNRGQTKDRVPNIFYYTSRELEPETGEYYYRARYYDPYTQRFLSEDPIGLKSLDNNFYRYVLNNPLTMNDPLGLYGTSSCDYYRVACLVSGGSYECGLAQTACNAAPQNNWGQCVRQCLQEVHKIHADPINSCTPGGGADQGGPVVDPSFNFWADHAFCFTGCTLNPENPYDALGPDLPDRNITYP